MKLRVDMRLDNAVAITDTVHTVWRVRLRDIRALAHRDDNHSEGMVYLADSHAFILVNADELIALTEKWLAWVERREAVPA